MVGRVGVNGQWFIVEYEGLHIICANCGCYGHVLKDCSAMPKEPVGVTESKDSTPVSGKADVQEKHVEEIPKTWEGISHGITDDVLHGEWLVVTRKKRTPKGNPINSFPKNKGPH